MANKSVTSGEEFLCSRNDEIDNATYAAICAMAHSEDGVDWSMEMIGEVNDFIEKTLMEHKMPTCHPFIDETDHICYESDFRCKHCTK